VADEWIVMIDSVEVIWPKASSEGHAYSKVVRTSMADPNCDTITTIYTPRTLCSQADCGTRLYGRIADVNRS
jgi:hypothetical protein